MAGESLLIIGGAFSSASVNSEIDLRLIIDYPWIQGLHRGGTVQGYLVPERANIAVLVDAFEGRVTGHGPTT